MTANPLEEAMRRVLNDQRIFSPPYDRESRNHIPLLFNKNEWAELRQSFIEKDTDRFRALVDQKITGLDQNEIFASKWRKSKLREMRKLGFSLQNLFTDDPYVLGQLFNIFNDFGLLECNLPDMEDFGKVIEGHSRPTVEQFFLYKIKKEKNYVRRQALVALLEVIKELYDKRVEPLEIAFFVRKIDSLTLFVEVLK